MPALAELRRTTGAARCLECGKCSTSCPLAAFGGFSAARMIAIQNPDEELMGHAQAVERCLTCGACEVRCPQQVHFTDFVRGMRAYIPLQSRQPCPHGRVLESAGRWMAGGQPPFRENGWIGNGLAVAQKGEVALFVGCLPIFDVVFGKELGIRMLDIARSAIALLNRLGIEPVLVSGERCCGHDLLWNGDHDGFEALAKANSEAFAKRGVKHILTTCAECCRTWRLDYPEVIPGYQPKVEHIAEFISARLDNSELEFETDAATAVTYQDPCRLGRHLGVFGAPRRVLGAVRGTSLMEMERNGRDALCCGTPGFIRCDAASRQLQAQRLRSAAGTGAKKLLTACPKCLIHFACAQSEDRRRQRVRKPIEVEDLTVFIADALGGRGKRSTISSDAHQRAVGATEVGAAL